MIIKPFADQSEKVFDKKKEKEKKSILFQTVRNFSN